MRDFLNKVEENIQTACLTMKITSILRVRYLLNFHKTLVKTVELFIYGTHQIVTKSHYRCKITCLFLLQF